MGKISSSVTSLKYSMVLLMVVGSFVEKIKKYGFKNLKFDLLW